MRHKHAMCPAPVPLCSRSGSRQVAHLYLRLQRQPTKAASLFPQLKRPDAAITSKKYKACQRRTTFFPCANNSESCFSEKEPWKRRQVLRSRLRRRTIGSLLLHTREVRNHADAVDSSTRSPQTTQMSKRTEHPHSVKIAWHDHDLFHCTFPHPLLPNHLHHSHHLLLDLARELCHTKKRAPHDLAYFIHNMPDSGTSICSTSRFKFWS